jgi:hypothetical protein
MAYEPTDAERWEIHGKVMAKYPKLPTERTCMTEFRMRQAARAAYREKLIDELRRAQTGLEGMASKAADL